MPNAKLRNYLHLHFIVFIWGFTAVLGALISIDAIPLVWYRMLIAAVLILGFMAITKKPLKITNKQLVWYSIGGILIAVHWLCFFHAIKISNVSVTLATMATGAFFTSILEPIIYKRKFILYELVLGLFVVAGLAIIFQFEGDYFWGICFALVASLLAAFFSILNGKLVQENNPTTISFYELLIGVLGITIYLGIVGDFNTDFFSLTNTDWLYIGLLASFCTAYAFIASTAVMKYLSPYTVMLTINLEPVYGILLAWLILGDKEQMSPQFYYGALIILITVVINGILKNRKAKSVKAV
ncbi:DMT family transporter [Spongiivirga citrea]|uniref:EamA family transporter n=1 Tax=Spongiivirga citrea TaxID=1481457 RepID=A0A6M0CL24_9FLAO|nr:DMT family transporter [Spongiivirga citrea]NER17683.1 EamA family transporter [Spongiivirga citrea]